MAKTDHNVSPDILNGMDGMGHDDHYESENFSDIDDVEVCYFFYVGFHLIGIAPLITFLECFHKISVSHAKGVILLEFILLRRVILSKSYYDTTRPCFHPSFRKHHP